MASFDPPNLRPLPLRLTFLPHFSSAMLRYPLALRPYAWVYQPPKPTNLLPVPKSSFFLSHPLSVHSLPSPPSTLFTHRVMVPSSPLLMVPSLPALSSKTYCLPPSLANHLSTLTPFASEGRPHSPRRGSRSTKFGSSVAGRANRSSAIPVSNTPPYRKASQPSSSKK